MRIQGRLALLTFFLIQWSLPLHAQSVASKAEKGCYACRVTIKPERMVSEHSGVTAEDSPICVRPGEDPVQLVYDAVRNKWPEEIRPEFGPQVKCVDVRQRAALVSDEKDGNGDPKVYQFLDGLVSPSFMEERKRSYQNDSKARPTTNDTGRKSSKNMTSCISLVPNAHYGELAIANSCAEEVEVAFCYLGSKSKAFECDSKRKGGWQRGAHTVQPGGKQILPDSKTDHKVIWYACEKEGIPKIVGYDQRIKKPIGQCK